eukprot:6213949-Pleurochrysis_carterae.AAC.5
MHKLGHPVATLPATNGTVRRNIRRMNADSANLAPRFSFRVSIQNALAGVAVFNSIIDTLSYR